MVKVFMYRDKEFILACVVVIDICRGHVHFGTKLSHRQAFITVFYEDFKRTIEYSFTDSVNFFNASGILGINKNLISTLI